jgi:hypothetical protein
MSVGEDCPAGTFSPAGSQECFECQAGFKCSNTNTGSTTYESTACSGDNCQTISLFAYQLMETCDPGYYCPSGKLEQIPCPIGTYNDLSGQSDVSACLDADPGYYTDVEASTQAMMLANECSAGYKCPAGSKSAEEEACAPGTYQGSPNQSTCDACLAGFYCPTAAVWPIVCPAGYFCLDGIVGDPSNPDNFPYPCPKGFYGAQNGLTAQS